MPSAPPHTPRSECFLCSPPPPVARAAAEGMPTCLAVRERITHQPSRRGSHESAISAEFGCDSRVRRLVRGRHVSSGGCQDARDRRILGAMAASSDGSAGAAH
eukprot:5292230-Prymnesium_polylepis.1